MSLDGKAAGRWLWELAEHLVDHDDHVKEKGHLNQISLESDPLPKTDGQLNPEAVLHKGKIDDMRFYHQEQV